MLRLEPRLVKSEYRLRYVLVRWPCVERIRYVWKNPELRSNNQRLIYLIKDRKNAKLGYTIYEFAYAIFPEKMTLEPKSEYDVYWGKVFAFKALHKMFQRFRRDFEKHNIYLAAAFRKLENEIDSLPHWYHYNVMEDADAIKDVKLRAAQRQLGEERRMAELKDNVTGEKITDKFEAYATEQEELDPNLKQLKMDDWIENEVNPRESNGEESTCMRCKIEQKDPNNLYRLKLEIRSSDGSVDESSYRHCQACVSKIDNFVRRKSSIES